MGMAWRRDEVSLCFVLLGFGGVARLQDVLSDAQRLYDRMMSFWNGKGGQPTRPGAPVAAKAENRGLKRAWEAAPEGTPLSSHASLRNCLCLGKVRLARPILPEIRGKENPARTRRARRRSFRASVLRVGNLATKRASAQVSTRSAGLDGAVMFVFSQVAMPAKRRKAGRSQRARNQ